MADLATQYYIKAMDNYPIDLNEFIESLDYALSYDDEHAGAHCLMGRFCTEYTQNFDEAIYHFEKALSLDIHFPDIYYFYSDLLIQINEFGKAKKLLKYGRSVRGIFLWSIYFTEGTMYEKQGLFKKAKKRYQKAIDVALNDHIIKDYKSHLKRVMGKMKQQK